MTAGYRALAPIFDARPVWRVGKRDCISGDQARLRHEIDDKNFHWWHRYRAVNGFSIYGDRGLAGSDGTYNNRDVMERERAILDQMTANRDARIWALAKGESVPAEVDDSNTLPFIEPQTNVGGDDDQQAKLGKLGSLDYLTAEEQQKLFKLAAGYEINWSHPKNSSPNWPIRSRSTSTTRAACGCRRWHPIRIGNPRRRWMTNC